MNKGEIAQAKFHEGYNCSQAVALAFTEELGLTEDQVKKLSSGFGGGIGRQRLTCGAVLGMTMVLGNVHYKGDKLEVYKVVTDACEEVKKELGSISCAELLDGVEVTSGVKPEERTKEYYQKRPCAEICKVVADITAKYLK